jgi:rubrerythrin
MITQLEGMLEKVEDDRVKYILEMMLDDEKRHHNTLKELSSLLDRNETAFEEYMMLFQKYMIVPPEA